MKFFVTASIVVIIACLTFSTCYALTMGDNGYKWNSSNVSERVALCKVIISSFGKDYAWWFTAINVFYESTDPIMLKRPIEEVGADLYLIGEGNK